jgi:hypothetical protein
MFHCITSKKNSLSQLNSKSSLLHVGLLAMALCWNSGSAQAQTRTLPSHGKIKLDSYNYLLRDVHPASQAQANYLQNRLFLTGLKKVERLERRERLDAYGERQYIEKLEDYQDIAERLSAGRPTSARNLAMFWVLVSVFGDRAEVYEALSSDVPVLAHEEFIPTSHFIRVLQPAGSLEPPPLVLQNTEGIDASECQAAWRSFLARLHSTGRPSASEATNFRRCVAKYCQRAVAATQHNASASGQLEAAKYLKSLGALADALYRPQQWAQIRRYVERRGYGYDGRSTLGLITHMLEHRVTPAQGSTAQLALAEVARPISRVLEQEIALHYERIDSLATGEGHRPYAAEYQGHDGPAGAMPNLGLSSSMR